MNKTSSKQSVRDSRNLLPEKLPPLATFAERLDFLIRLSNLNQVEVAEGLGIGQPHISGLRSGKTNPSRKVISKAAALFNCREEWLAYGTGEVILPPSIERPMPKDLERMILEIKKAYDETIDESEKFALQGELYQFLKNFHNDLVRNKTK